MLVFAGLIVFGLAWNLVFFLLLLAVVVPSYLWRVFRPRCSNVRA
jgi:hypothetical protein